MYRVLTMINKKHSDLDNQVGKILEQTIHQRGNTSKKVLIRDVAFKLLYCQKASVVLLMVVWDFASLESLLVRG